MTTLTEDLSPHNFKTTEIGDLPTEWEVVRLGDLGKQFFGGGTPSTKRPEFWNGDVHWTTSAYINDSLYLHTGAKQITEEGLSNSSSKLVPAFNLLIGTRVGVGKVAINSVDMAISQDLTGMIVDRERANAEFLAYLIRSDKTQESFGAYMRGTTIKGIPRKDLVQIPVPLPPLDEQRRIAHVLNTVQQEMAAQADLIAAAQEAKRSLMRRLFTYGPGPEPAPTKETEIGEVPEHWEVKRLGDLADIKSGGTPSRQKPEYWGGDIPWVKTGEVDYSIITFAEENITQAGLKNSSARLVPAGTLLMAMYGQGITRGKVAILGIDAAINQACAAFFPKDNVKSGFLFHYLSFQYERIRNLGHGAHQKNLSATLIKTIELPIPPVPEQHLIAHILQTADAKIAAERDRKAALQGLFNSLLQELMTGRLRVNHLELSGITTSTGVT